MSDFDDRLRQHRSDPVCARVGRYLDEWSRAEQGEGYPEDVDSWQWQAIDATGVVRAGPDPAAIRAALTDSGFIPDDCTATADEGRRLAELAAMLRS